VLYVARLKGQPNFDKASTIFTCTLLSGCGLMVFRIYKWLTDARFTISPSRNSENPCTITLPIILIRRLPSVYTSQWLQEKFQFSYTLYIGGFLNAFSPQNRCVRGSAKLQKDFMRATRTLYICNPADSSVSLYVLINYEVFDFISAAR